MQTEVHQTMEGQFQLLFDKMKIEMQNQTAELKDSITKSIMDSMDEKLIPIVEEKKELKIRVDTLEKEIESLKRAGRSNNIVVFGIEEKEKSTIELLRELKEYIKQDLNIDIVKNEQLRNGRRKPKPLEENNNKVTDIQPPPPSRLVLVGETTTLQQKRKRKITNIANTKNPSSKIGAKSAFADWQTDLQKIKKSQIVE
ncbi:hypothetical protein WA026_013004 [Henosepilachna vigintioctopunctata]|uniref:Uncharacterized protein n=1 Tax=Henosepilachna vigintioctopunctata TaxID=420089 RepID=A0AAW1TT80_9CUCU